MPIYEYECQEHGAFEAERPMVLSAQAGECPVCRGPGRRVLSTVHTSLVPRNTALARDRNEKSQHAPELRRASELRAGSELRQGALVPPLASQHPQGLRASHGRPWVLEHG